MACKCCRLIANLFLFISVHSKCSRNACSYISSKYRILVGAERATSDCLLEHDDSMPNFAHPTRHVLYSMAKCKEV